eukprot:CAMPEP_0173100998 /NCGR_PEP_ID=MMETSP1102-20130122/36558_1 /TAXON_ID=49646 /ORGANISM="Geminigera sp., Strain Caron Lab Isolate" /LENGTH=752 /DNA_ID=CAMNT_0013994589 /DNA_START=27 /DNA_END=2285 /DNA_ORIENTATION=-
MSLYGSTGRVNGLGKLREGDRYLSVDFDFDQATLGGDFGVGLVIETRVVGDHVDVSVKDLVAHGSADKDGRVEIGDKILKIGEIDTEQLVNAGGDSGSIFRKHLKGPSGTTVDLEIQKQSGAVVTISLTRGNAGYWALYDALHIAKLDIVSLKRDMADALVAVDKVNAQLALEHTATLSAEEQARKDSRSKTDAELRVKNLQNQIENLYKEMKSTDDGAAANRSAARSLESALAIQMQESSELNIALETEQARCKQALARDLTSHKLLLEESNVRRVLEKEVETLKCSVEELQERLLRVSNVQGEVPKLKARAEDAERKLQRFELENASFQKIVAGLQEEIKELRASEAKYSAMVSAATSDAKRYKYELELCKPQMEQLSNKALEAGALYDMAQSETRMAKLAVEPLQKRIVSLEQDYSSVRAQFDDLAPVVDRERQAKIVVERLLQETTDLSSSLARDLASLQDKLRERDGTISSLEATVKDTEPQLILIPAIKAKILALASENRDLHDQVEELTSETSRLTLSNQRAHDASSLAIGKIEELNTKINTLKMVDAQKLADMERRINEDVYFLTHERDHYKTELNRYYGLPNPVGVGMSIEETIEKLPTGGTVQTKYVKALLPGLSADLSGVVRRGDLIISVDGVSCVGMSLDDLRSAISGVRGSKVTLKFVREKQHDSVLDGAEFSLVLKRGSWGPEHAVVVPEDLDMHDKGRWPVPKAVSSLEFKLEDINRHNIISSPAGLQEKTSPAENI